jgi:tetratricopeptide (TPR) repeat protein
MARLGYCLWVIDDIQKNDQAVAWGERALKLAEALGAEDVSVSALNNIGSSLAQGGDFEIGYAKLQESLQRAIAAGLPEHAGRAYFNLGIMYQRQCRYKQAEDMMKELYAYSVKYYTKTFSHVALWRLMWINWYTDDGVSP